MSDDGVSKISFNRLIVMSGKRLGISPVSCFQYSARVSVV